MTLVRLPSTARRVQAACVIGLIATIFALPSSASAQHRARLSRDLTRQIQQNPDATVNVIAEGPQSEIDRIARQYGLQVVSRLDSGARLSGTAAQIDQAAGDGALTALAEDARVTGTMAVTTQSTGASQLWGGGKSAFDGITGKGVNVVIIDSGIAHHTDLDKRVVTWIDYVDPQATERVDTYGHGTHVAGIIAGSGAGSRGADGGAYIGMAPATGLISIRVLGDGRLGPRVGRHQGHRVVGQEQRQVQHPRDQSLARSSRDVALQGRSAGEGGRARGRQRHRRRLLGRQSGQDGRRHADRRRHRLARRHAWRADGGSAEHARHGRAERRWRRDVQLARSGRRSGSAVDVGAQAGRRCAGQRDCVGRSAGHAISGTTTRHSACSARTAGRT